MLAYLARRLVQMVVVLLAISVVTFGLFYAAPRDPARQACGPTCDPTRIDALRHSMGLDQPIATQYLEYMRGIVLGREIRDVDGSMIDCSAPCLGYSYYLHQPVLDAIVGRFPATLSLAAGALAVVVALGVTSGFVSALRRGSLSDRFLSMFTLVGASVQIYFLGYVLQYYLVYQTGLFPTPGYTPLTEDPLEWLRGLLLPWLVLGFVQAAVYARIARSQMLETMGEEYVRTGRSKGLGWWRNHLRYTSRGAAAPLVQLICLEVGTLLGGAVITETVFGVNGIGQLSLDAITQNDLPTVVGTVMLAAFVVVLFVAVADLVIAYLDPRVRLN
ncbi:ABC transporter permease [Allostreptomyces psammosilenae]|uniref:Peptide/nickel transport system permease protein n=1 Tax=Allostreptomyces psammosilenae TaxID=1892865 RepID=A0A852ZRD0_9ACTN|nr:ABC transporter permease [Allostreptomyces psammosilenae]NYI05006.1 peptide/nickel transport system permease protein [Allostreptomyces psammosilenae]